MRILVSASSWLLPSFCLRYGLSMPSVCPCGRAYKHWQFNDFHSDSPLTFTSFWLGFGDVGKAFRRCEFFMARSRARSVLARTLQSWTCTGSSICLSSCFPCLVLRWKSSVDQLAVVRLFQSASLVRMKLAVGNDAIGVSILRGWTSLAAVSWCHTRSVEDG
jgi:hypothetical protein